MNIWVMRHGEAGFNASSDSERTLTSQGESVAKKQGEWLAKRLNAQQIVLDKILVSPYRRTQQTLDCLFQGMQAVDLGKNFTNENLIEIWEGITPSGDLDNVCSYLAFLREEGAKNVLIISHLPLVYDLVLALTAQQETVHFYPAIIAEIDWQSNFGKITAVEKP
ncbi:phosphohistidine phosphatase SixA [Actinobacillus suis]|uniref:Phosphohistidine phosphatase n=2 Tax=Actinobacillus suis TaxID=716 RepID=K0G4R3_ACTSU|nr:phosphohistidine phosphatase SixA [Actinobacillus suis]AFU19346.1 phosphohistidine phosphatase [Actinobacillus suis H91-0380]AIJ31485.1 phosphohistidine phosphatase [Actinobacillus suis ATCC 33415]MCO4166525.1 phosphohistidine phosphatase SixA [Actinobacillus suis]MCO4168216.1 phosphohistidine phosphatase SixA [Actinobacillus suis]MCQ9629639.1 phosphohistidine phosphatase SixA [Actinobacillus suis]